MTQMQQRWYYYSYAWYVVIIIHHTGNILITRPSAPMAMALRAHATPPRVVCSLLSGRAIRIDDIRPFPTRTDYQEEVQVCCKTCSEHFDCIHRTGWFRLNAQNCVPGNSSRRFFELDHEILHTCSGRQYLKLEEGGFLIWGFAVEISGF